MARPISPRLRVGGAAVTRSMLATLALLVVFGGCGKSAGDCRTIDDRISELERDRPPASEWGDIADLQDDIAERDRLRAQRRSIGC